MADDKSNFGGSDRPGVAGQRDHEIDDVARRHGLTREQARVLIRRVSHDALEAAFHQPQGS